MGIEPTKQLLPPGYEGPVPEGGFYVARSKQSGHFLAPSSASGGRIVIGAADTRPNGLTARSVGEFRDKIRAAGVKVPTARKILATLHSVLAFAVSQDFVAVK
jgi:hypothetical protein